MLIKYIDRDTGKCLYESTFTQNSMLSNVGSIIEFPNRIGELFVVVKGFSTGEGVTVEVDRINPEETE